MENPTSERAIERALSIRDLTDPAQGAHAIQQIVEAIASALASAWPDTSIRIARSGPIVAIADNYDRLGYERDAITRDARYSRYVDDERMLRSHTSAMIPALLRGLASEPHEPRDVAILCPGMVYRRDCIDRLHTGEPHQIDLWRVGRAEPRLGVEALEAMIDTVTSAVLPGASTRTEARVHPYTCDGRQIDVRVSDAWIEIGECGTAHPRVLSTAGLDPSRWSGLAMGLGLDRILMVRKGIPDIRLLSSEDPRVARQMTDLRPWRPVSSMPATTRDLSVVVDASDQAEDIGDRVRDALGGDASVVEEVSIRSQTAYGDLPAAARARLQLTAGQKNVLVRIVLRDTERTLTHEEANVLRDRIYEAIHRGPVHEWASSGHARGMGP